MNKKELKKEIMKICYGNSYRTLHATQNLADQILSLLAPTIEKAEKWDKVKECADSRPPCKCPLWEEDACTLEYGGCIFRYVVDALEGGQGDKS